MKQQIVQLLVEMALHALRVEAKQSPSPGLVSALDSGAHSDMDVHLMLRGATTLGPYLGRSIGLGREQGIQSISMLRECGIEAERAMLSATRGVNTHKGAFFLLLLAGAAAGCLMRAGRALTPDTIGETVAEISSRPLVRDLHGARLRDWNGLSTGLRAFVCHGLAGVRGEAIRGLRVTREVGVPTLRQALAAGLPRDLAMGQTLLSVMAVLDDTTVLNRRFELAGLKYVQRAAGRILELGGMYSDAGLAATRRLHDEFVRRRISPGGSADVVALSYTLTLWETCGGDRARELA